MARRHAGSATQSLDRVAVRRDDGILEGRSSDR